MRGSFLQESLWKHIYYAHTLTHKQWLRPMTIRKWYIKVYTHSNIHNWLLPKIVSNFHKILETEFTLNWGGIKAGLVLDETGRYQNSEEKKN